MQHAYSLSHSPYTRHQLHRTASSTSASTRSPFVVGVDTASLWLSPKGELAVDYAEQQQQREEEEDRWALHPQKHPQGVGATAATLTSFPSLDASPLLEEELDEYEQLLSMDSTGNGSDAHNGVTTEGGDFELFAPSNKSKGAACSYDLRDHAQSSVTVKHEYPNYGSSEAIEEEENQEKRDFKR